MFKPAEGTQKHTEQENTKQSRVVERLKDFKGWRIDKVGGEERVERGANVVFFFEHHSLSCLEVFKEHIKKNNPHVIVLEEGRNRKFKKMLGGRMSVEKYMRGRKYDFPEFAIEKYKFLQEFHKERKEVKIEQLNPEPRSIKALLGDVGRQLIGLDSEGGSFEGAVDSAIHTVEMEADYTRERDCMRAARIAGKIRKGEWSGNILVEAGAYHTRVKNVLKHELGGMQEVSVDSIYPAKGIAKEELGMTTTYAYMPLYELKKLYSYEKHPSKERERLLGARFVIFYMMFDRSLVGTDFEEERRWYEATERVNRLDYEECRHVFGEIRKLEPEKAFEYVRDYLEKRIQHTNSSQS